MREIKFRAWNKFINKMYYPCDPRFDTAIEFQEGGWIVFSHFTGRPESLIGNRDGGTLMQYTGLKDKNGTEIYEGDILQRSGMIDIFSGAANDVFGANPFKVTTEVVELKVCSDQFGNTTFGYSLQTQRSYSERTNPATYEVIGNIYQNPELIEKQTV